MVNDAKTLIDCAVHWERTTPDRRWLTQPMGDDTVRTWTFRQALDETRRIAAYLESLGLPRGSSIALCSKNCAWWVFADLAIWMAGHVSVPLYPVLTTDIVKYVLEHSQSRLLFVGKLDPIWDEMKAGVPAGLPVVTFPLSPAHPGLRWNDLLAQHQPLTTPVPRDPGEVTTIIYTSGSTGRPKGAMQTFGALNTVGREICAFTEAGPNDRSLSYLPLAHSMERSYGEAAGLHAGGQAFYADRIDTFLDDLRRARPTLFLSVPRLWLKFQSGVFEKVPPAKLDRLLRIPLLSRLVKKKILGQLGLDCVRLAGSGSAPIPAKVIAWYRSLGLELLEGYAMTENNSYSHIARRGSVKPGTVGPTMPGVECRIAPDGEILVKSPGNMLGYYRDPAQTAELFTEDGFVRTGDLGSVDEQGRLAITGRKKEIFKTDKGKYIAPAPIENRLLSFGLVEQCCVSGSHHPQPYAVAVLSEEARKRAAANRAQIEQQLLQNLDEVNRDLPAYEHLEFIAVVDDAWLPENGFLTPTLKVKRARIEQVYGPLAQEWFAQQKPVIWHQRAAEQANPEHETVPLPAPAT